ncbi:13063_t:CDS:2 [Entrophospora sp. SA101]|nr:13059_t:CDS:2 [Entrophospora sp. SA101]CAJ0862484.1 13063_t:CDS:2 [Entrophospora sp. SA101]
MEIIDRAIICGLIISVPLLVTSASRLIPFFQNKGLIDDDIWPEFMMTAIPFITFITFGTTSAIRRQLPTSSPKTPSSVLTKTPNSITFPSSFNNHDYNYDSNNNYNNYNDHNNDNNPSTMVTSTFSNRVNATTDPFINRRKQPPLQLNIHQNNRSGGSSSSNNNNISRVDSISKRIDKNAISKRDYDHSSLLARAMSGKSILKLIDDVDDDELKERNENGGSGSKSSDDNNTNATFSNSNNNNGAMKILTEGTTFKIVDNSRQSSPEAIIQIPTINITKASLAINQNCQLIIDRPPSFYFLNDENAFGKSRTSSRNSGNRTSIRTTSNSSQRYNSQYSDKYSLYSNDDNRNSFRSTSSFISYNGSGNNLPSTPSFGPPKRIQSSLRIQVNINDTDNQLSSSPTSLTPRTNIFNADKSKNK